MYIVVLSPNAKADLEKLRKSNPLAFKKASKLLVELVYHPYTGTGKPERLKYDYSGYYSRRITKEHRLVYMVDEGVVTVMVVSVSSHYEDK